MHHSSMAKNLCSKFEHNRFTGFGKTGQNSTKTPVFEALGPKEELFQKKKVHQDHSRVAKNLCSKFEHNRFSGFGEIVLWTAGQAISILGSIQALRVFSYQAGNTCNLKRAERSASMFFS